MIEKNADKNWRIQNLIAQNTINYNMNENINYIFASNYFQL